MATTEDLPGLPFARTDVLDMPPLFRQLQAEAPVARVRTRVGDPAWLISRYEDVRSLLVDARLGRSHPDPDRAARFANSAIMASCSATPAPTSRSAT